MIPLVLVLKEKRLLQKNSLQFLNRMGISGGGRLGEGVVVISDTNCISNLKGGGYTFNLMNSSHTV